MSAVCIASDDHGMSERGRADTAAAVLCSALRSVLCSVLCSGSSPLLSPLAYRLSPLCRLSPLAFLLSALLSRNYSCSKLLRAQSTTSHASLEMANSVASPQRISTTVVVPWSSHCGSSLRV